MRRTRNVLIAVAAVGLLLLGDRGAEAVAAGRLADRLASREDLRRPDVSIAGWPFVTQGTTYDRVEVDVDRFESGAFYQPLRLRDVRLVLRDVRSARPTGSGPASGTARIGYRELSDALRVTVYYAGDGRVATSASVVSSADTELNPTKSVRVVARDGAVAFTDPVVADEVPAAGTQTVRTAFGDDLPLDRLPLDLSLTSALATREGVLVRFGRG